MNEVQNAWSFKIIYINHMLFICGDQFS